ncbi:MAG: polysaccharide biosynthesis/export family protein [Bacteroidales bacterium]|nr:polysaccharide biosynthesis/export family protein [Bacteroidales bacterium]MCF6342312.1 polysaccharide biosynthesis/export family protein [Bacteroidales bacterium]
MKKHYRLSLRSFVWLGILALLFSSCVPQKKILYMQVRDNTDTLSAFKNERNLEYRVQPGDNLYIRVVTFDEKTTTLLNPLAGGGGNFGNANDAGVYLQSYTITDAGYLDFPMTGEVYVRNMNVNEIRDLLTEKLKEYLIELVVIVKLVNFNLTMLGELNKPGQYKVYQTDINLFEAVSMAGDLTDFANRNKIAIIRQTKAGSKVIFVDMTKRDILASNYYYLKPNDIVYAQPVRGKQFAFATFPYGVVFGFISTTLLLINYFNN